MEIEYIKSDQEYNDRYDRMTITRLKSSIASFKDILGGNVQESVWYPFFTLRKYKIWQDKQMTIDGWKKQDQALDSLVRNSIPYNNVRCLSCSSQMKVVGHFLKYDNSKVVFLYDCTEGHKSRRAFYTDGIEYVPKKKQCPECNDEISVETIKKTASLTFIEECVSCNYRVKDVMELKEEKPIREKDRQRFCIMSEEEIEVAENVELDIENIHELAISMETTGLLKQEDFNIDKIEILKLPNVEKRLAEQIRKKGFTKFRCNPPKVGRHFIVEFSVQDESDRHSNKSIRLLKKEIKDCLFYTNWRLMSDGLTDRLGFITGRIRGYETDEDILKLGKEITQKLKK